MSSKMLFCYCCCWLIIIIFLLGVFLYSDPKHCVIKKGTFGDKVAMCLWSIQLFPQRRASLLLHQYGHGILDRDLISGILHFLKKGV